MNCLDFRRAYLTDPYHLDEAQEAHVRECDACARYANRQTAAERRLEAALRVSVPRDLAANVIFERSMRGRRSLRLFALAAGLVLTLAATFGVTLISLDSDLQDDFIAHMQHDPLHLQDAMGDAQATLQQVTQSLGISFQGEMSDDFGQVVAARRCDVDGHQAAHFVIEENGVRATAFLVPHEALSKNEWMENDAGQHGMLIPTKGGVIAVFCPERQMLVRVGEQLQRSVQWAG